MNPVMFNFNWLKFVQHIIALIIQHQNCLCHSQAVEIVALFGTVWARDSDCWGQGEQGSTVLMVAGPVMIHFKNILIQLINILFSLFWKSSKNKEHEAVQGGFVR